MKLQLSTSEMLLYQAMRLKCISVKLTKSGELQIKQDSPPDYLVPRKIKQINLQEALKLLLESRIWFLWENDQLYMLEAPKVKIVPLQITPEGFTSKGALIISIDGAKYTGYKEIASAIFGGYRKNLQEELGPYLRDNFDLTEVIFEKIKKIKGQDQPVYLWRGQRIWGINNLRKKMFWLTEEDLSQMEKLYVENRQSLDEERSNQLIRLFDLSKEGNQYMLTNPENQREELTFTSKKKVISYIRDHKLGGSISRETAKQVFQIIEKGDSK